MTLSVCSVSYNEEWIIARTFNAVKDIADEMILVDSGSTDQTRENASSLGVRVYIEEPYKGCGLQKNAAIENVPVTGSCFLMPMKWYQKSLKQRLRRSCNHQQLLMFTRSGFNPIVLDD